MKDGLFFINLCKGINKDIIKEELVLASGTKEKEKTNAKYAITTGRKLGATLFTTHDDINEINYKMIWIYIAELEALSYRLQGIDILKEKEEARLEA